MTTTRATVHGAVSIVNAISTGLGSALGISLKVTAETSLEPGSGIKFQTSKADNLINSIVRNTIPHQILINNRITVKIDSEIPIGYGLKSSSAVSNAVSLACSALVNENIDDINVLDAAVRASLDSKVTITGAYDDATACYFGGFTVTDNYSKKIIRRDPVAEDLFAAIFLPRANKRGNLKNLTLFSDYFTDAFRLAADGHYWKAMRLNGILTAFALSSRPDILIELLKKGVISASISGNGPSLAAICKEDKIKDIKNVLENYEGRIIISRVNNKVASVERIG